MKVITRLLWLALPLTVVASPLVNSQQQNGAPNGVLHANHIFNALHNSMKEFGSVLQHNGMSIFIATVPSGTEFYHGTSTPYRLNGTQFLAFEPEHALAFAHPSRVHHSAARERIVHQSSNDQHEHEQHNDHAKQLEHETMPHAESQKHSQSNEHNSPGPKDPWNQDHAKQWEHENVPHAESWEHTNQAPAKTSPGTSEFDKSGTEKHENLGNGKFHKQPWKQDHAESWKHANVPHAESWEHTTDHTQKEALEEPRVFQSHPDSARNFLLHSRERSAWSGLLSRLTGYEPHEVPLVPARVAPSHSHDLNEQGKSKSEEHGPKIPDHDISTTQPPTVEGGFGYLHTYRTKHELRLVYFDGQSAAKSIKGTLDTQDIVLRNASHFEGSPIEGDRLRGEELCAMARDEWDNSIDGFIRMVGGFEVILCSFADHLDVVSIVATYPERDGDTGFSYIKAISTRSDGIGGDRVDVDYDNFVTMFAYPDAVYFDKHGLPRVVNDTSKLRNVRGDIRSLVKPPKKAQRKSVNWQAVVDMIMVRYSYRLDLMISPQVTPNHHELRRQLHLALEPFIDATSRNQTLEAERCAMQFWPSNVGLDSVPAQAVYEVSRHLCSTLVQAAGSETYDEGITLIQELRGYLDWTSFIHCDCKLEHVCQLPIWPSGSAEDFVHPKCGTGKPHGSGDYWDMMGRHREH